MDRKRFYPKEKVTNDEFRAADDYREQDVWNNRVDDSIYGVIAGLVATLSGASSVAVTKGIAIDQLGRRVKAYSDGASTKTQSYTTDTAGGATAVTGGNERWISIYANVGRLALDSRIDGNGDTQYFDQPQNLHDGTVGVLSTAGLGGAGVDKFKIVAGTSAPTGTATRPALLTDAILLCDILRTPSDASNVLSTTRRQIFAIADTTAPDTGNGLAVLMSAMTTWLGGRTNPAQSSLHAAIDKIITDLSATTASDDGAERIGAQTSGALPAGSVRSQLDSLDVTRPQLSTSNTYTGGGNTQAFAGAVTVGTTLAVTGTTTATGQLIPTLVADETTAAIKTAGTVPADKFRVLFEMVAGLNTIRVYLVNRQTALNASDTNSVFGATGQTAFMIVMGAKWTGLVWQNDGTSGIHPSALVLPLVGDSDSGTAPGFMTGGLVLLYRNYLADGNALTWANTYGVTTGWTKVVRLGFKSENVSNLGSTTFRAGTSSLQVDSGVWVGVPGDNTTALPGVVGKAYYLGSQAYHPTNGGTIQGRETLQPSYNATPTATVLTSESTSNAGAITITTLTATSIKWSYTVTTAGVGSSYSNLEIV